MRKGEFHRKTWTKKGEFWILRMSNFDSAIRYKEAS
jgi:hypothetical protein